MEMQSGVIENDLTIVCELAAVQTELLELYITR
jgi:hypothetical protein